MNTAEKIKAVKGGEFLIKETKAEDIFIPDQWSEEQKMIKDMCDEFIENEVLPHLDNNRKWQPFEALSHQRV